MFAAREAEGYFDLVSFEIEPKCDERNASVVELDFELVQLLAMHEELPLSLLLVIELIALFEMPYMDVLKPEFFLVNATVSIGDDRFTIAKRFDFGAGQHDTGFDLFDDVIFVPRTAILGDRLDRLWTWWARGDVLWF